MADKETGANLPPSPERAETMDAQETAAVSPEHQLQQNNIELVDKIQQTEALSQSIEKEIVVDQAETSLERTSERAVIEPPIVGYFQEMGLEECLARLNKMSETGREILVADIKKGNLPKIVNLMEMFSPDNLAEETIPGEINDKEAWGVHTDKLVQEHTRRFGIAARHDETSAKSDPERWKRLQEILDVKPEEEDPEEAAPGIIDVVPISEEVTEKRTHETDAALEARVAQLPGEGARNFYKGIIQNPETIKILFGDRPIEERTDTELLEGYDLLVGEIAKGGRQDFLESMKIAEGRGKEKEDSKEIELANKSLELAEDALVNHPLIATTGLNNFLKFRLSVLQKRGVEPAVAIKDFAARIERLQREAPLAEIRACLKLAEENAGSKKNMVSANVWYSDAKKRFDLYVNSMSKTDVKKIQTEIKDTTLKLGQLPS